jgi:hypothetical protein
MKGSDILDLYHRFENSLGKEGADAVVKDITNMIEAARLELATKEDVGVSELKLTKEIEEVRFSLTKEIEIVRKEIEEVRLRLTKEIEIVRKEIGEVKLEVEKAKTSTIKWITGLLVVQTGVLISIVALLLK